MPTTLTERARDRSTFGVVARFTDEADPPNPLIPNALTWSLLDSAGTVVNSRSAVSIAPAASVTIVLSGADLVASEGSTRVVLLEGTYDSDLGADLPLRDTVTFQIANLIGVN
jgi:hypothetical protein